MATVQSITKGLAKMVKELEALANKSTADAQTYMNASTNYRLKAEDTQAEANNALAVADKIKNLYQ